MFIEFTLIAFLTFKMFMRTRHFLLSLTRNVLFCLHFPFLTFKMFFPCLHFPYKPTSHDILTICLSNQMSVDIYGEFGHRSLLYMRTDIILHFATLIIFERTFPVSSYLFWEVPISILMRP